MSAGVALALAALVFFPFALDSFELPHQLILAVGATLVLARGARTSHAVALAAAAICAAALLATLMSQSVHTSAPALVGVLVLSSLALSSQGLSLRPLLWAVWPIAAYAVLQRLGRDPIAWNSTADWCGQARPFSTLGHPTQLGVWMALAVPLALHEAAEGRSRRLAAATAAVAAFTCVLTLSRAGWLALATGAAAFAFLRGRASWRWWATGALAVALAAALGGAAVWERVQHFFVAPTRLNLWHAALLGFLAHPVFGWGLDSFVLVAQQYRQPQEWLYEWGGTANHAHGLVPQLLATQGLAGLAVHLGVAAAFLAAVLRRRHAGAAAAGLAFLAAEMVTFSGVAVAALGVTALAMAAPEGVLRVPRWLAVVPGLAVLATLSSLVASTIGRSDAAGAARFDPWNATWHAHAGLALETRGELAPARAAYERAAALEPLIAQYDANVGRVAAKRGDAAGSRVAFDAAVARAPRDARIGLDAAEAALSGGELDRAEAQLLSVLAQYPMDGPAWWAQAKLRFLQGRRLEERAALEAALAGDWRDWPEGETVARQRLAVVLAESGDVQAAFERLSQAPKPAPADICGAPAKLE